MCATFAETEVISLLAQGERREDIAASVHRAVAARTLGLVAQVGKRTPVVMTGGVAKNPRRRTLPLRGAASGSSAERPADLRRYGAALLALDAHQGERAAGGRPPRPGFDAPGQAARAMQHVRGAAS